MFLRGCEELGLKGSQLFDPGDLQDTSIRANLTYVCVCVSVNRRYKDQETDYMQKNEWDKSKQ